MLDCYSTIIKETFRVLQNVKKIPILTQDYDNLRTPKTASISTKNGSYEPQILNGASDGINFEPKVNNYIVKFLYLCLHDEETIELIKTFLCNKDVYDC